MRNCCTGWVNSDGLAQQLERLESAESTKISASESAT
jgi:hypothetical protein